LRALVVGGCGFVGRAFVAAASKGGTLCTIVGRAPRPNLGYRAIDLVRGSEEIAHLLEAERPDLVVDLSGTTSPGIDLLVANVTPTRNLLGAIDRMRGYDPRVVVVGSAAEYGDLGAGLIPESAPEAPVSGYGEAKLARTRLALAARRNGRRVLVVRPFNIIGPGMPGHLAPARFALSALAVARSGARELTVGNLSTVRDYLDVAEVARALWALCTADLSDEIVNICSGQPTRTSDLLDEILRQVGISLDFKTDPKLLRGQHEIEISIGDPARLTKILGRRPIFDLTESIHGLIGTLA